MFEGKTFQWHSHIKIHLQAHRCLISRNALCFAFCFRGLRRYMWMTFQVQKPAWRITDQAWHCIERTRYLWENRPLYLHLVNLSVVSGWISSNYMSRGNRWMRQAPSVEKHVIGVHSCSGIPFGPLWLQCLSQAVFVCVPVTKGVCVCAGVCISVCVRKHVPHQIWWACACCCCSDLLGAEIRAEGRIRILKTSLGTSGCDWQEKKGLLCSGNWQRKPDPTQCNPAQYSTEPANTGKWKKYTATAGLLPFAPPYLSRLLANSHNPTVKPLAAFFFFINSVQSFAIPSISI